ncbi:MAG: S9 family peptidase [Clostridium sp.]|nr:S9 family peptidase [Clostridium sp.]
MGETQKLFTLDDLIPGGKTFYSHQPENIFTTWWGDRLVRLDADACYEINIRTGKENLLLTTDNLNTWLKKIDGMGEKAVSSTYGFSFPFPEDPWVLVKTADAYRLIDFEKKEPVWQIPVPEGMNNPDWSPVSRHLAWTKGGNLCVTTAQGELLEVSTDGSNDIVYGQSVHRNEFGIEKGTFWSPKGDLLAFYRMDQSMVPDYPLVDISTRIATALPCKYPMAGEPIHRVTVGIYNPQTRQTVWLKTGEPAERYFTNLTWGPDGKHLYIQELNRAQSECALVVYNVGTGEPEGVLYRESHPKYVEPSHPLAFLPWDESKFILQSQRDGFNHLYVFDLKNKVEPVEQADRTSRYTEFVAVKQLTSGPWVVQELAGFNPKDKSVIIRSTECHPLQSDVYAVNVVNGKRTLLDDGEGVHNICLSAGGQYLTDRYSNPEMPRMVDVRSTRNGKAVNILTSEDPWIGYDVPEITCASLRAADRQTDLYYRMVKPVGFDPAKQYPVVVYVYGGPHAHLVEAGWNYNARGWEIYMAQKGYLVFVLDGRGSENRGLEFENVTYGHLGEEEMKDQMEGIRFLQNLPWVDKTRIGVHGWSFGGFMTTNLMLTYPDVFKVGVAGGPVVDWQYYEAMYGERYMGTPQGNPEGYQKSNLREKAGNLRGKLQVIIGYEDPVCVPQHTLSFMRACIDAGTQPDLFMYPGGEHNMVGQDRVHLHERITQYFEDNLK